MTPSTSSSPAPALAPVSAWRALFASPRELWLVFAAKYLEGVSLYSVLYTATLWLSVDHGLGDVEAGVWFGAFGTLVALLTMVVGFVVDWLGVRRALVLAFAASAVARAVMTLATSATMAKFGLLALAVGTSAGVPVMNAALRQYSTPATRPMSFAIYYALLNLGAMTAALSLDATRAAFPALAYRALYAIGTACAVLAFVVALFLRVPPPSDEAEAPRDTAPSRIARDVVREAAFWRFMLLVALVAMVTLLYQHFHATWPKYVLRELGASYPLGRVASLNSGSVLVLVPLVAWLTSRWRALDAITVGTIVSVAGTFILCLGAYTSTLVAMVLVLSLGEAFWAPRFYAYAASIAPRGREATYMSLASLPMFLAKVVAGPVSGVLLARYCPEEGPRDSARMWLIIASTSAIGPVLLVVLRRVITGGEPRRASSSGGA